MKIIQSYWTKPLFKVSHGPYNRNNGGWLNTTSALCAMAYSCLSIRRFYDDVELITDDFGYDLLISKLCLPYTSTSKALNALDVSTDLWALGKVYCYGLQDKPFIHVDNDIFIWGKFPERIELANLCCQNMEEIDRAYLNGLDIMKTKPELIPKLFKYVISQEAIEAGKLKSINAGIIGGNNVEFFKYYSDTVFSLYKDYVNTFFDSSENDIGTFNIILEQVVFWLLAHNRKEVVECLYVCDNPLEIIKKIVDVCAASIKVKYIHPLGGYKRSQYISNQVEFRFRAEYPSYYDKIRDYCKEIGEYEDLESKYIVFKKAYDFMSRFSETSFMNEVIFKLNDAVSFRTENGVLYTIKDEEETDLTGWGKILLYFTVWHTGNDIVSYAKEELDGEMSGDDVKENVFSYLLKTIYNGSLLLYKLK